MLCCMLFRTVFLLLIEELKDELVGRTSVSLQGILTCTGVLALPSSLALAGVTS